MLVWQLVIMVMSIMLKIHRYVGVAAGDNGDVDHAKDPSLCWCGSYRQVEVEGCCGVQVGVDGGHKLSQIITNCPTNSTSLHHFTSITSTPSLHAIFLQCILAFSLSAIY